MIDKYIFLSGLVGKSTDNCNVRRNIHKWSEYKQGFYQH